MTPFPANPIAKFSTPPLFSIVPLLVNVADELATMKTVAAFKAVLELLLLCIWPPTLFTTVTLSVSSSDLIALFDVAPELAAPAEICPKLFIVTLLILLNFL